MKKVKIVRIIARLNVGGPAIHVAILSAGLDKSRFETVLACGSLGKGEADMSDYARSMGVAPYMIPELGRELDLFGDLSAFIKIYRLIQKEKPDMIHTHTAKAGTLGRAAGILYNLTRPPACRAKLIHTFHGHIFNGYFNAAVSRFFLLIEQILALFTSRIIAVSPSVKKELVSRGVCPDTKARVIPLGFDLGAFLSLPAASCEPQNIGIVGRLVPVKDHRLFLEAAALLALNRPYLKFKVIGDGELKAVLIERANKLGIGKRVEFLGWQRDLASVYSGLDIVVLTSLNEGTPVSLIEAMACGRSVVATDVGGVPDLLDERGQRLFEKKSLSPLTGFYTGQRGMLVSSRDPAAFSAALEFLIREKEVRERFTVAGREFVRNNFSRERLIRDIEELYLEMMDTGM
ncbi:MAG: glycosyltransferase [Candidatus Omnitrophota bacterium]|nr:glycosyltransferase [Candidatus Omnitrophota bacterium]